MVSLPNHKLLEDFVSQGLILRAQKEQYFYFDDFQAF